jgi:hypothetical protein
MINEQLMLANHVFSNRGAFAIFLGSGISRPAGIATGWEILAQLISRLAILEKEQMKPSPEEWYKSKYGIMPGYSQIIEKLTSTSEERVNLLRPFFEATDSERDEGLKQPTNAHRYIAKLVQKGYIKVIVTTNFDRLMENALREIGLEATIISNPNHIDNVMPLIHSSITIIKINGDYLDTKFLNIEAELGSYDNRLVEYLKFVFENFGLITSGWSATWDIALKDILHSANKFRFSNYFTYITNSPELLEMAASRKGKALQIIDANHFFQELYENVEALESGIKDDPLSKPIALARLKKYIERPDQRIPLYELVSRELDTAYKAINFQSFPNPDEASVRKVIEFDLASLNTIASLSIQGIHWGNEVHHNTWLQVVSKFAHPVRHSTSYAIWSSLAYLPALVLFYGTGISALHAKDYTLLKKLFYIQINNPYRDGEKASIYQFIQAEEIIEGRQLNKIMGTNQYVPHSELLFKYYKHQFDQWMPAESSFEELFDTYELLFSLMCIKIQGKAWFPKGRYIYRRRDSQNIIYSKLKEFHEQKEALDWIEKGLFKDVNEMTECYNYFNQEVTQFRH